MSGDAEGEVDWIALSDKRAKGRRPDYHDFATDRLVSIVMALVGEVSVLRQRLDTAERLLEASGALSRAAIEAYEPDRQAGYERGVETKAYISRVMRGVQQAMEAMAADDKPVDEVIAELREM